METGINIVVNGYTIDIGDPSIDIIDLVMYLERMIPATRMRLIMTLLGRREEYEEFLNK